MAKEKEKKIELKHHDDVEEYLPYAVHFDENTILTKNGELFQTIKVTGYAYELVREDKEEKKELRELVRQSIKNNITEDKYAIWIHTIRRQKDISTGGVYKKRFSKDLNEKWIEKNAWRTQFINELYITVVVEGEDIPLKNPSIFFNSLFIERELQRRKETLILATQNLSKITNSIIQDLSEFGAEKLSIFKRDGIYYSELMGLASKIMNLRQEDIPLIPADLSTVLPTNKVNFQYNAVQVETPKGKYFGAIFSSKEYREINTTEIDRLIQLPVNFIISECLNFVSAEEALENFKDQKKIYDLSGAKYMREISGIKEIFEADSDNPTDFCTHQIIITVLEDSVKELQKSISSAVDVLRDIGEVFIREDLFIETCYWSTMPANFDFIKRPNFIPIKRIGGYATLSSFTSGKLQDNHWGAAVTTFLTLADMPYFFNFHIGNNGHTAIIGLEEKLLLQNFLISQAQKFEAKTIFIEAKNSSENFITALGGKYYTGVFDSSVLSNENIVGINLGAITPEKATEVMRQIEESIDSVDPKIISIDDSISGIEDDSFNSFFADWCERLIQKNAVVILGIDAESKGAGVFTGKTFDLFKTKIFTPNKKADFDFSEKFSLKEKKMILIKELKSEEGEFLLKRGADFMVIKFDKKGLEKQLSLLVTNKKSSEELKAAITESGSENPEKWLPTYYSKMKL